LAGSVRFIFSSCIVSSPADPLPWLE
jgi:hypothetical protein